MPDASFSALLLAGGRSVRMGQDKTLLDCAGEPLWLIQARKLQALQPVHLFIACREEQGLHQTAPEDMKAEWLFDPPGQGDGPMLPILTALQKASIPLLVLAVDMPDMTTAFLDGLLVHSPETAFFYQTSHGIEPLAGVYSPALIPLMQAAAAASKFSLRRLIETAEGQGLAKTRVLSPADEIFFNNMNNPGEWLGRAPKKLKSAEHPI